MTQLISPHLSVYEVHQFEIMPLSTMQPTQIMTVMLGINDDRFQLTDEGLARINPRGLLLELGNDVHVQIVIPDELHGKIRNAARVLVNNASSFADSQCYPVHKGVRC